MGGGGLMLPRISIYLNTCLWERYTTYPFNLHSPGEIPLRTKLYLLEGDRQIDIERYGRIDR